MTARRARFGFTLLELSIALAIGAFVAIGARVATQTRVNGEVGVAATFEVVRVHPEVGIALGTPVEREGGWNRTGEVVSFRVHGPEGSGEARAIVNCKDGDACTIKRVTVKTVNGEIAVFTP